MNLVAKLSVCCLSAVLLACTGKDTAGYVPPVPDIPGPVEPELPADKEERLRYIRIVAVEAQPYNGVYSSGGRWALTKEKGLSKDYTAQDIIEMVGDLKPHRIERILTGCPDPDKNVPVREGFEPMTVREFLNALSTAGDGCDFAPKLDLNWLKGEKSARVFWESAQNLYDMQLDVPIRTINLDCWNGYIEDVGATKEERSELFRKLREIGYTEIGVNMTGHVNDNDPEIDYVVFTLKKDTWTVNETALARVKSWPNIKKIFQYIDYPEPFTTFFTTYTPDQQADIYAKNVVSRQDELGITYAWPILQGAWDATAYRTSESGKYKGMTLYEVFKYFMYQ